MLTVRLWIDGVVTLNFEKEGGYSVGLETRR